MNINQKEIRKQMDRVISGGWLGWFQEAAKRADTSTAHFLAIGSRETNLRNIRGDFRGGIYHGFGVMQVDVGTDPAYARNWTPQDVEPSIRRGGEIYAEKVEDTINGEGKRLKVRKYTFTGKHVEPDDVRRIATAGYNCGRWAYYHFSRGEHIDSTTTGHDYSRDVYDRAIEFAALLQEKGLEPNALRREVELQGKYATEASQKRAGVTDEEVKPPSHLEMAEPLEDQSMLVRADARDLPEDDVDDDAADTAKASSPAKSAGQSTDVAKPPPPETTTVPVQTVTPSKDSSFKRLWTMLGLGGVGLGTYFTQLTGWLKNADPTVIKIIIFVGVGAVLIYLIGQFVNGMFDRWAALQMNRLQAQSAMNQTVNTVKFIPPESGQKE